MSFLVPLRLKFWGVRGSIPTPQPENLGVGGNTACLEVRYGGEPPLILDGGSGLRLLGQSLLHEAAHANGSANLVFTHFHWDHIQGLPFFAPLFEPGWKLSLYSPVGPGRLEQVLAAQLKSPYFPAEAAIRAERSYVQLPASGAVIGSLTVRPFPVRHPGGAHGYRIEAPSASIVYVTDHEHGSGEADQLLREYARDAGVLVYDAQYTPQEYEERRGWGHSTWLEAVRLANDAGARQLVLFHHDPEHDDAAIARIVSDARAWFENTMAASEGLAVSLPEPPCCPVP